MSKAARAQEVLASTLIMLIFEQKSIVRARHGMVIQANEEF